MCIRDRRSDIQAGVRAQQAPQRPTQDAPPKITDAAPTVSPPVAPKRTGIDEDEWIRRYAHEISKLLGSRVSERDYPRLARQRYWEGTTHLALRIESNGTLNKVSVLSSSGHDILDQRAVDLINRLKLPGVPSAIQSKTFTVKIPVRFALRN